MIQVRADMQDKNHVGMFYTQEEAGLTACNLDKKHQNR